MRCLNFLDVETYIQTGFLAFAEQFGEPAAIQFPERLLYAELLLRSNAV